MVVKILARSSPLLVQLHVKTPMKFFIHHAIVCLRGTESLEKSLADGAIGNEDVAVPVVVGHIPIGKSDLIPRSLVILSTTQARAHWAGIVWVNNLWHYLSNLKGPWSTRSALLMTLGPARYRS
jgi:hypothetical protein